MNEVPLRERVGGRPDLADVEPYRVAQPEVKVRLNTNESPYPPPPAFFEDLYRRISELDLHRYPDSDAVALREGLANKAGTLTTNVWAANGSNEILLQILLAFGGGERRTMTFEPTYVMHSTIARISGTRILRARRNPDFSLHLDASVEAVQTQKPDVVLLCSPNNPTGDIVTSEAVRALCKVAPGLVVLDEAYAEFSSSSLIHLSQELDNLVVTRSFSKAWRLAGIRLGYMVAQPTVIDEVLKARLPYHLSALTQAAGLTALEHAEELASTVETIKHERERVSRELSTTSGVVAYPSHANFVLFRTLEHDAAKVWSELLHRGVLIRDFSSMAGAEGCLRVSVGTAEQNEQFLETLSEVLGN